MNQIEIKKKQAGMISYMLGLVILLLLANILEENGIAYTGIALECFWVFFALTGGCLADALGRLVRVRSSKGQYKNAKKLRRNAFVVEFFLGFIGSAVMFLMAEFVGETVFGVRYSVPMIRILAPVVFIRTMSSLLLGYFQGEGTELPTVIAFLMRPFCVLGFSLLFVNLFKAYGQKVSNLLRLSDFTAMYSGMGVALAMLIAEAIVLLFLFLVYRGSRRKEKRNNSEGMRTTDTFAGQIAALYRTLLPAMITLIFSILPLWLGSLFYCKNISDNLLLNEFGVLVGKVVPVLGLFIIPGCMLVIENTNKVAGCIRRDENRFARGYFQGGLHMTLIYGFFAAVFVAILAGQIGGVVSSANAEIAANMFRVGAVVVLFSIVSFYLSEVLEEVGSKLYILGLLLVSNLIYAGSLIGMLKGNVGIMALVYAALIAGAVYMIGTIVLVFMQLRYGVDWLKDLAVPVGSACVVGLILLLVGKLMTPHLGNLVTIILAFVIGNILYWIILMLLRNFREQELNYIPCGRLIHIIGQMLRVF